MATKATTTKKPAPKATKARAVSTKSVKKPTTTKKKPTTSRAAKPTNTVDYYPNRMTVAVSALAGTILVLVAVIAVLGARG